MKAVVFNKPFLLELEEKQLKPLGEKQLRVQVEACGICGTDYHIFKGEAPANSPVILGHEFVGKIVEKGLETDMFQKDERIAIDPNIHCGICDFCRNGHVNLCTNLMALGVTHNGGFAEYATIPISQAYHIPSNLPANIAALAEPLSCCLRGIYRASIKLNDTVAIVGGGTIGLLMVQLAQLSGASKVILIEPIVSKREIARQLGVDSLISPYDNDAVEQVIDDTDGGADVVIECVGRSDAAQTSLEIAKPGGTIVFFGLASQEDILKLHLQNIFHRELTIKTSLLNPFTFQTAVDLLISDKVKIEPLNPESIRLEDMQSFFMQSEKNTRIKYQVLPGEN